MQHSTIPHTSLGLVCPVTARRGWLYVAMLSKPPFVLHVRAACRAGQCKVQEGQSSRGGHGLLRRCVRHKPDGSQAGIAKLLCFCNELCACLRAHTRAPTRTLVRYSGPPTDGTPLDHPGSARGHPLDGQELALGELLAGGPPSKPSKLGHGPPP